MDKKALVIITEGTSPQLLEQWCAEGLLPGFARVLKDGAQGNLRSDLVPYEPPGLISAFTGRSVGDHGWFSYWDVHNHDYRPQPVSSAKQSQPFLWQRPELSSARFAVVNVFGTHPPTPLNGWLVTYPMLQTVNACYPRDLLWSLSRRGVHYTHDVSIWFSGQSQRDFLPLALEADRRRGEVALTLLGEGADVVIANLTSIDRTSHCYWQELEEGSPVPATESAIFQAYRQCDQIIARCAELVSKNISLLAFSEIGFGPLRAYCSVNQALEKAGFHKRQPCDTAPVLWDKTIAFEAVQGTHGVNINLAGRYAHATVKESDYYHVREQVMAALRGTVNPYTGLPMFRRVFRREEVYAGQCLADAPDIILAPADERYLPLGDSFWARHVNRTCQSGWHRRDSYWAGMGDVFSTVRHEEEASLLDIAPTIFEMLGVDTPSDFTGSSLTHVKTNS